ncbi:Pycsar system effector family protein [Streptomyces olivoreticuli]
MAALIRGALSDGSVAARATAGVAAGVLAVAIMFIVLAFLPQLRDDGTSFPRWAELTTEELQEAAREDVRAQQVGILSRMATAKFRHLRAACWATGVAALLLLAANVLAAVG